MKPLVYNSQPSVGQCKQQSRSTLMGSALSSEERVPFHLLVLLTGRRVGAVTTTDAKKTY